jgi:hypothetical protein
MRKILSGHQLRLGGGIHPLRNNKYNSVSVKKAKIRVPGVVSA